MPKMRPLVVGRLVTPTAQDTARWRWPPVIKYIFAPTTSRGLVGPPIELQSDPLVMARTHILPPCDDAVRWDDSPPGSVAVAAGPLAGLSASVDGRSSAVKVAFAELGRRVGLSTPGVIERVKRLEANHIILGYRAMVDPAKVGLPVRAFVKVTIAGDKLAKFAALTETLPKVLQCYRV